MQKLEYIQYYDQDNLTWDSLVEMCENGTFGLDNLYSYNYNTEESRLHRFHIGSCYDSENQAIILSTEKTDQNEVVCYDETGNEQRYIGSEAEVYVTGYALYYTDSVSCVRVKPDDLILPSSEEGSAGKSPYYEWKSVILEYRGE